MAEIKTYAVVLVGGMGKRLRPLSTESMPKAFLSVTRDRKTMFRRTLERITRLIPEDRVLVVANKKHVGLVKKDFPSLPKNNLLLEPVSRNTAPAIALAAAALAKRDPDATMVVLPTDQYIANDIKFCAPIKKGIEYIESDPRAIVVIGVKPIYASTHFGYIKIDAKVKISNKEQVLKVYKFVEKPDDRTAEGYVSSGQYLWNTGVSIFKAATAAAVIKKFAPKIYNFVIKSGGTTAHYSDAPDISIDYAVIEKAKTVHCVTAHYEWYDLGSFESLVKVLKMESRNFTLEGGKIIKII